MSFEDPTKSGDQIFEKDESQEKIDSDRRSVLAMLAGGSVLAALPEQADAHQETCEIFTDWKQKMETSGRANILEYPDVLVGDGLVYRARGVAHVPETLVQNFEGINADLDNTSAVLLEYFDDRHLRHQNTPDMALSVAGAEGNLRDAAENNLYLNQDDEFESFFATIGGMAANKGKDVLVLNPETDAARKFSGIVQADFMKNAALAAASIGGGIAAEMKRGGEPLTRRDFLVRGGLATSGALGTINAAQHQYQNNIERRYIRERYEAISIIQEHLLNLEEHQLTTAEEALAIKIEKLYKCILDWRDCVTALGILKMAEFDSEKTPEDPTRYAHNDMPITHYEGAAHHAVLQYLANPKLAEERLAFYKHTFSISGTTSLRRFRYDREEENFNLISEEPVI